MSSSANTLWDTWCDPLLTLGLRLRDVVRASLASADQASRRDLRSIKGRGAGDWTFGLDEAPEREVALWHAEQATRTPLSVFTEDEGWRHLGPDPVEEFPHGAPRIVIDPVDGTRPLMTGLASAWVSIALAAGNGPPRSGDVLGAILVEIPPIRITTGARLVAGPTGPARQSFESFGQVPESFTEIRVDDDTRVDQGFFPIVRYHPLQRLALARREDKFWRRVERAEGAQLDVVWDDQVISNVAQLVAVARGHYRMCIDARPLFDGEDGARYPSSKPYDVAGALHVAKAAGVALEGADGQPLDFPLDATTPVHFAAYHNAGTLERLAPHWLAAETGN